MRSEHVHCGGIYKQQPQLSSCPSGCILLSVWMPLIHGNNFCDQCLPNHYKEIMHREFERYFKIKYFLTIRFLYGLCKQYLKYIYPFLLL